MRHLLRLIGAALTFAVAALTVGWAFRRTWYSDLIKEAGLKAMEVVIHVAFEVLTQL